MQQDGFLDKELITVADLDKSRNDLLTKNGVGIEFYALRTLNKQIHFRAFYMFEDHFSTEELERHFDFYEPFTVHESSLISLCT